MKRIDILILALILSLAFVSCNNDDEEDDNDQGDPSMTALIDGQPWSSSQSSGSVYGGIIGVTGLSSDDKAITISLTGESTGTYILDQQLNHALAYTVDQSGVTPAYTSNGHADAGGTVVVSTINETDKLISGTFSTIVYRHTDSTFINITEGVFTDIPYITEAPQTSNTMSVKIDGVLWTPPSVLGSIAAGKISISGNNSDVTQTVGLTMTDDIQAGTYNLVNYGDYIGQYNLPGVYMSATSGTLVITEHNTSTNTIKGTFNFEAEDMLSTASASITEGVFDVTYQ